MKKIQLGTVKKEAYVQVIYLDASFITKAVKAKLNAEMAMDDLVCCNNGEKKFYHNVEITQDCARRMYEEVFPFLCELVDALEEKEDEKKSE